MNTHELCCVGHITLDKVVTPKNTVHMPGGTSFYFSHAIKHFDDIDYTLVTALAESEMKTVEELRAEGIDVAVMPSKHTVYFENIYGLCVGKQGLLRAAIERKRKSLSGCIWLSKQQFL